MGTKPQDPDRKIDDDEIENESAAPLPSREAMSIIDPSAAGPKIPYWQEPSIPPPLTSETTDQGIDESEPPE